MFQMTGFSSLSPSTTLSIHFSARFQPRRCKRKEHYHNDFYKKPVEDHSDQNIWIDTRQCRNMGGLKIIFISGGIKILGSEFYGYIFSNSSAGRGHLTRPFFSCDC